MGCCKSVQSRKEKEFASATAANSELLDTIQFLRATPMFTTLRQQEYPKVAAACTRRSCVQGELLVSAGDTGAEFFVVKSGVASMWTLMPVGGICRTRSAINSPVSTSRAGSKEAPGSPTRSRLMDTALRAESQEAQASPASPGSRKATLDLVEEESDIPAVSSTTLLEGSREATPKAAKGTTRFVSEEPEVSNVDSEVVNDSVLKLPSSGLMLAQPTMRDGLVKVATLKSKDYFGERALIWGEAIDVTVVAESEELECIVLSQEQFRKLGLLEKLRLPKRKPLPLPSFSSRGKSSRCVVKKSEDEAALIFGALGGSEVLGEILGMSDGLLLRALTDRARRNELNAGEVLIDPAAHPEQCLYVVEEGGLVVHPLHEDAKADLEVSSPMAKRRLISLADDAMLSAEDYTLDRGGCYGELALLYEAPYDATVKAIGRTVVWTIGPVELAESMRFVAEQRADKNAALLDNVEIFSALLSDEKWVIGRALVEAELECGRQLTEQGKVSDTFCILVEGEVSITKDGVETDHLTAGEGNVEYFGQEALAQPFPLMSPATVTVASETARCLTLSPSAMSAPALGARKESKKIFGNVGIANIGTGSTGVASWGLASSLGSVASSLSEEEEMALSQGLDSALMNLKVGKEEAKRKKKKKTDLRLENIKFLCTLGKGAFGLVQLCEHEHTKELYALKKMKKARLCSSEVLKGQVLNEKRILQMTDSSFITKLHKTFKTEKELLLLLEPALGGELYNIYFYEKFFGKQQATQFYAASVVCALTHLHERYIIYRDLKPENVLLDSHGRLKLADMGLAKFVVGKTYTVCGTPVYMAPEAARQSGYTVAVDWWSLGILVWELLTAKTPFQAQSRGEVVHWLFTRKVLADLSHPDREWPSVFTEPTKDFMCALLAYEPGQRVPMQPDGAQLLRGNPWFNGLDWEALEKGTLPPPYSPPKLDRKNLSKLKNFRAEVTDEHDNEEFVEDDPGWDTEF